MALLIFRSVMMLRVWRIVQTSAEKTEMGEDSLCESLSPRSEKKTADFTCEFSRWNLEPSVKNEEADKMVEEKLESGLR